MILEYKSTDWDWDYLDFDYEVEDDEIILDFLRKKKKDDIVDFIKEYAYEEFKEEEEYSELENIEKGRLLGLISLNVDMDRFCNDYYDELKYFYYEKAVEEYKVEAYNHYDDYKILY